MNKKGFTLVELLAVIAILAILAVLAVPAIINLFKSSKDNLFAYHAQEVFKSAEKELMSNGLRGIKSDIKKFDSNDSNNRIVSLDSGADIYCIKVSDNKIVSFAFSDGSYWYYNDNISSASDISPEDISHFGFDKKSIACDANGNATLTNITE